MCLFGVLGYVVSELSHTGKRGNGEGRIGREMISNSPGKEGMEREGKGSFPALSSFLLLSYSIRGEDLLTKGNGVEEEEVGRLCFIRLDRFSENEFFRGGNKG